MITSTAIEDDEILISSIYIAPLKSDLQPPGPVSSLTKRLVFSLLRK